MFKIKAEWNRIIVKCKVKTEEEAQEHKVAGTDKKIYLAQPTIEKEKAKETLNLMYGEVIETGPKANERIKKKKGKTAFFGRFAGLNIPEELLKKRGIKVEEGIIYRFMDDIDIMGWL